MGDLDYLLRGDPTDKVRWHRELDVYGDPVYGGRRTIAHLEHTDMVARRTFTAARNVGIQVLQGGFNTDVEKSAGTHDYDGCIDAFIPGVDWWEQQAFFRRMGWAWFIRYPPLFGWHGHGISLGCKGRMGVYVPGQIADYYAHKNGLAGHADDNTWHPRDISSTIFNYTAWKAAQEDDMQAEDWNKFREIVREEIAKAGETVKLDVGKPSKWSLETVMRSLLNRREGGTGGGGAGGQ